MKKFGDNFSKGRYLLPLLLALSFFFISQGIILPEIYSPSEARLFKPQEVKPLSCIISKEEIKSSHCRIVKAPPFFTLHSKINVTSHQLSYRAVFDQQYHLVVIALDSSIPARAPPA